MFKFPSLISNSELCFKIKCNNDDIFEIKDVQGNVKERINNSAGIYSPLQVMPEPIPKIETLLITTILNEKLCITCPGYDIRLYSFINIYMS